MNDIVVNQNIFESIKHIDEEGREYWSARELQKVLEYNEWRNFKLVINKSIESCKNSKQDISHHFVSVNKMVDIGSNTKRKIKDYKLSRYACYIIAQNADSRKEVVSLAQTYFAIQTRRQELSEIEYDNMSEIEKRLYNRNLTKRGNYRLNQAAKYAGVKNFDRFHNAGYRGLYNGETADDIAKRKNLRYREDILDNMGSSELIMNMFRIDQTNQKLKRDNINGENKATNTHYEVGREVRETVKRLGGTMPEDLPLPNKSLKQVEKDINKNNKELRN